MTFLKALAQQVHYSLREKCLERQKWNNRTTLSAQTFLMIGRRSLFSSMLRSRVGRCGEKIAVCVVADLELKGLIGHTRYGTMQILKLFTELSTFWEVLFLWCFISLLLRKCRSKLFARWKQARDSQWSSHNLPFDEMLCHLANPSAGAAPSHIWGCGAGPMARECDIVWHSRVGT